MSDLVHFPFQFWLSLIMLLGVAGWGWRNRAKGWGLPAMAVSFTAIAWYQGDAVYNDYLRTYKEEFPPQALTEAWLEVALFALAFGIFVGFVPDLINAKYRGNTSQVATLLSGRRSLESLQASIEKLAKGLFFVWLVVFGMALWRTHFDVLGLIAPYIKGQMAYPWGRSQVAQSISDSLASFFENIDMVCAALFGVCAAVLKPGWKRNLMLLLVLISWPAYLLNRTRNEMLTVLLPGLLTFTFLRLRGRWVLQATLLIVSFLAVNVWFKFVEVNRGDWNVIAAVVHKSDRAQVDLEDVKHGGFNMFEELCWLNLFINEGSFTPANGELYFANLVNPIPRALWPGKPEMLTEYPLLRGAAGTDIGGVTTTFCIGMIGSGVINFGQLFGPVAAALLLSLWCAFLARLDLTGQDVGRLLVYTIGMVLTFNFGRDITFLVAYPFLFAFALLWAWRKFSPHSSATPKPYGSGKTRKTRRNPRAVSEPSPFAVTTPAIGEDDSSSKPQG